MIPALRPSRLDAWGILTLGWSMVTAGDGTLRDNCAEAGPFPGPGAPSADLRSTAKTGCTASGKSSWPRGVYKISQIEHRHRERGPALLERPYGQGGQPARTNERVGSLLM